MASQSEASKSKKKPASSQATSSQATSSQATFRGKLKMVKWDDINKKDMEYVDLRWKVVTPGPFQIRTLEYGNTVEIGGQEYEDLKVLPSDLEAFLFPENECIVLKSE